MPPDSAPPHSGAPLPANETARLAAVNSFELLDSAEEEQFDDLTKLAAYICDAPISVISLIDENRQWFMSKFGLDPREMPREFAFCAWTILQDDIMEVPDALLDDRFKSNPLVTGEPKIRFYAGKPLVTANGLKLGTLCVVDNKPRKLSPAQREALTLLSHQAMRLIELRLIAIQQERLTAFNAALVQNAGLAIVATDRQGVITHFNRAAEGMLGYKSDEAIGRLTPQAFHLPEEIATRAQELSAELEQTITPGLDVFFTLPQRGETEEHEWTYVRKDGSHLSVLIFVTAVRDETGELRGYLIIGEDISARKKSAAILQARTTALESAVKELETFSYSVSHDLRSPLRGIDGWSLALAEDCADDLSETGRGYLDRIRGEAQRLGTTIDNLLNLARVNRGEFSNQSVNLSTLARKVIERFRTAEPDREIECHVSPDLKAKGDPVLLEMLLQNLLGNAWKFTAKSADARLEFGQEETPDGTIFFVRDNGIGFAMNDVEKLFTAFNRLHKPSDFAGTGIGLAIVQRIIHRHGGRVWAQAELDHGAVFHFIIPQ